MGNCTSCGMPCSGTSCSMCYGDPFHGDDGYYQEYIEQQMMEEARKQAEEEELARLEEEHMLQERIKSDGEDFAD